MNRMVFSLIMILSIGRCHASNIKEFSQHFNVPNGDISPWVFVPQDNIKEMSTSEHPGLLTIWLGGRGKDIKGITREPIKIGDYRLPWEFKMSLLQNYAAMLGFGAKDQMNYAIGLNVALTFSDPNTWPNDRSQRPQAHMIFNY
jgi:hypothetical protein